MTLLVSSTNKTNAKIADKQLFFLSIQSTYNTVDFALFKENQLLKLIIEDKISASKNFVLVIENMLQAHQLTFSDISFAAVNAGPGPFTTLRVVIASVNGLSFASNIPLIGIDALDAFLLEYKNREYPHTVVLLNAFNNDVYFGIQDGLSAKLQKGYDNIVHLLEKINNEMSDKTIRFLGNGTALYAQEIRNMFGEKAFIPDDLPQTCSIKQVALLGLEKWEKQEDITHQLFPLYLKQSMN